MISNVLLHVSLAFKLTGNVILFVSLALKSIDFVFRLIGKVIFVCQPSFKVDWLCLQVGWLCLQADKKYRITYQY